MPGPISEKDVEFIEKRRRLAKWGNAVGAGSILALAAFAVYFYGSQPHLLSPFHIAAELEAGRLDQTMLESLAFVLPVYLWGIFVLLAAGILCLFALFHIDRRYLRIIDQLKDGNDTDAGRAESD